MERFGRIAEKRIRRFQSSIQSARPVASLSACVDILHRRAAHFHRVYAQSLHGDTRHFAPTRMTFPVKLAFRSVAAPEAGAATDCAVRPYETDPHVRPFSTIF